MRLRCLAVLVFACCSVPASRAETDTGSAHNFIFKHRLDDSWYLSSRNLLTTREGFDDTFFGYLDLNLGYDLNDAWSVEAGYRHAWREIGDDWRDEYRPSAILGYRTMLDGWSFSNRHRVEYRVFESGSGARDRIRYRNETRLIAPWQFGPKNARLFAEEEFFYEFTDGGFNFNWLTGGIRWQVRDGVIAKLGYRWQAYRFGEDWDHRHQLVTGLLFFF